MSPKFGESAEDGCVNNQEPCIALLYITTSRSVIATHRNECKHLIRGYGDMRFRPCEERPDESSTNIRDRVYLQSRPE
jgi:hypothetical protein